MATAKRDLQAGEMRDCEGGYCVSTNAVPARNSHSIDALPIGLAHNVKLKHSIAKDRVITLSDVELEAVEDIISYRKEMTALLVS